MKKPRSSEEIERIREKILKTALEIISRQGLEALTMRSLAAQIGMSAPNLYNYFADKDAIYLYLVAKGFQMLREKLEKAHQQQTDKAGRARAMLQAYLDFGRDNPRYYDIMFTLPTPKYNDYRGTAHESLSAIEYQTSMEIAQLAAEVVGDLTGHPPQAPLVNRRVIQVWSLLHGLVSLHNSSVMAYVAPDTAGVYDEILQELTALVHSGLN